MKRYTMEDLKKRISKKYHSMIDWEATMFCGFHGSLVLIENDQTHANGQARYIINEPVSHFNWYLKKISENPGFDW